MEEKGGESGKQCVAWRRHVETRAFKNQIYDRSESCSCGVTRRIHLRDSLWISPDLLGVARDTDWLQWFFLSLSLCQSRIWLVGEQERNFLCKETPTSTSWRAFFLTANLNASWQRKHELDEVELARNIFAANNRLIWQFFADYWSSERILNCGNERIFQSTIDRVASNRTVSLSCRAKCFFLVVTTLLFVV